MGAYRVLGRSPVGLTVGSELGHIDIVHVPLESLGDLTFGLSHVLFATGGAADTIYQVGALATNVGLGRILEFGDMANNLPGLDKEWAVSAVG